MTPKVIFVDVDGIMTDGTKLYINGKPTGKTFYDRDFTAIKFIQSRGIYVCFITADNSNRIMAKDRNIPCFSARDSYHRINKGRITNKILQTLNCTKKDAWSLGDDIFDVAMFKQCEVNFCPANASKYVQDHASHILRERDRPWLWYLAERYLDPFVPDDIVKIIEIDKNESWNNTSR